MFNTFQDVRLGGDLYWFLSPSWLILFLIRKLKLQKCSQAWPAGKNYEIKIIRCGVINHCLLRLIIDSKHHYKTITWLRTRLICSRIRKENLNSKKFVTWLKTIVQVFVNSQWLCPRSVRKYHKMTKTEIFITQTQFLCG